jgi:hypothetical protein
VTARFIDTNTRVVSCDVCGRTLLAGESADVFLHGGERRNVCDLCTARAAHEGWIREGMDAATVGWGAQRNGRSRGVLARLRQRLAEVSSSDDHGPAEPRHADAPAGADGPSVAREHRNVHAVPTNADMKMARALELFNASSHRRTVAGVARSLGPPIVTVRPSPTEGSVVTIVVGWELSWYRYEVDLGDEAAGVRVTAQGAELSELEPEDQRPNAAADERGTLHLAAQAANPSAS